VEPTGWLALAVALAGGGNIVLKFKAPVPKETNGTAALEIRLKEYFGYRFDRIAEDIKKLSEKGDKQDEKLAKFYDEFNDLKVEFAKRFGRNGHD
jgi:hypothetical protein